LPGSILVTVPVPPKFEIDSIELEGILSEALKLAEKENIRGKDTTPFLLGRMSQKSEGKTLAANIALLENNAKIAAKIAAAL
jgi:pseudouridine-5'-phosphate glycosidase